MRHLNIQRAVLVGLSLGGMVAMDFALEHPERVEALVLCAPGADSLRRSLRPRGVPTYTFRVDFFTV